MINFVRRFISGFAEIAMPLQETINNNLDDKWTNERKDAFMKIKE